MDIKKKLEICCYSFESAVNAQLANADRIELCENIHEGGTTPSYGMISLVRKKLYIDINVIIRPRGGDFFYTDEEFSVMKEDIINAKKSGVNGIVTGILTKNGNIHKVRTKTLVELAYPLPVTFHRAFDMTADPFASLEDIIETGAKRLLTSGLQQTAYEGINMIKQLKQKANGRIIIMPGSGINSENIKEIAEITDASEFHSSAKTLKGSNEKSKIFNEAYYIADINKIQQMKRILDQINN